jgi:hypothetical protein
MASRSSFFSVSFLSSISGEWTVSRHFSSRRAATAWARFLRTQSYVRDYAIHRGGPGGERFIVSSAKAEG